MHGDESLASFSGVGHLAAKNLHDALHGKLELGQNSRILDFGCGCGRVLLYLKEYFPSSAFYGTDIDEEAIKWCQGNIGGRAEFAVNSEWPPLPFVDEYFDFVYGVSVFTHLPEKMQFAWLAELPRVVKPGGWLALTVHGLELSSSPVWRWIKLRLAGFRYAVGDRTQGLPDFYQTTYHTEAYVRRHWSKFLRIEKVISRGLAHHQDLVLCRRPDEA